MSVKTSFQETLMNYWLNEFLTNINELLIKISS